VISQDEADALLSPHYGKIAVAVVEAYRKYRKYPGKTIHRRTTRATIMNDEISAEP
jgi:hypothetical protein